VGSDPAAMKSFMRNPRTAFPALAVFVALVLSFAIPPFNSVLAAGSSSSSSSMSSASSSTGFDCDSQFTAGTVHPGQTISGTVFLNNGCRFTGDVNVHLNNANLVKAPQNNGRDVAVSVQINSMTQGLLDDPVAVNLHQGINTITVTGPATSQDGSASGTGKIDASFDLEPNNTTTTTTTTTTPTSCDRAFEASGNVAPGDKVTGTLSLNPPCRFVGKVTLDLNGATLKKDPAADGSVHVTVEIKSLTQAVLDDPVNAPIHTGHNVVDASGLTNQGTVAHVLAGFTVVSQTTTTVPVTPIALTQTTPSSGGTGGTSSLARTGMNLFALFLLALMAIALGTYTVAAERAMPVTAGAPLFEPALGSTEQWTLELVVLTAVAYILGPPPGRHTRKGPRGLVPALRDWLYRDR
jgi:hypothetical protein